MTPVQLMCLGMMYSLSFWATTGIWFVSTACPLCSGHRAGSAVLSRVSLGAPQKQEETRLADILSLRKGGVASEFYQCFFAT